MVGLLDHKEGKAFIEEKWKELKVDGWMAHIVKEKLKYVKEKFMVWNREVYGIQNLEIDKVVKELNDMEEEGCEAERWEGERWKNLNVEFWRDLHHGESLLAQKAKAKWVRQGDGNSKYFHNSVKLRQRRNQLEMVKVGEQCVSGVDEVKEEVSRHFSNQYKEGDLERPTLDGIDFKSLNEVEAERMTSQFLLEEVKKAVWSCEGDKSPGPDGFNFTFIKGCWETIKDKIFGVLPQFHANGKLPRAFKSSFVALIGKKANPQGLNDYRPISLIGCVYKIIAKVLAKRIKY